MMHIRRPIGWMIVVCGGLITLGPAPELLLAVGGGAVIPEGLGGPSTVAMAQGQVPATTAVIVASAAQSTEGEDEIIEPRPVVTEFCEEGGNPCPDPETCSESLCRCTDCLADLDLDRVVGYSDMLIVLANWGPCTGIGCCPGDVNGDGNVDFTDLNLVLASWGPCP